MNQIFVHHSSKTGEKRENCHHWGIWPVCLEGSEEASLGTLLSPVIFSKPQPNVPVACMTCDNHINLSCLSLPLTLFSPPAPLLTFSNSLETQGAGKSLTNSWLLIAPPPLSCVFVCVFLFFSACPDSSMCMQNCCFNFSLHPKKFISLIKELWFRNLEDNFWF